MTSTSSIPVSRPHELSAAAALLLTIGGNMLVITIAALSVVGVGVAALAVFGQQLMGML